MRVMCGKVKTSLVCTDVCSFSSFEVVSSLAGDRIDFIYKIFCVFLEYCNFFNVNKNVTRKKNDKNL